MFILILARLGLDIILYNVSNPCNCFNTPIVSPLRAGSVEALALQQKQRLLPLQVVQSLDLDLHDPQHRVLVFAMHHLAMPIPSLLLLLVHHRARLQPHDPQPTLEQPFVQIIRLPRAPGVVRLCIVHAGLERVLARTQDAGAVEAKDVAWEDAVEVEGEPESVAFGQQIGEAVDVRDDVVRFLHAELGKEVLERFGEDERSR